MTASPSSLKGLIAPLLGREASAIFDPDFDSGAMSFHTDGKHFLLFVVEVGDLDPERVEVTYVDLPTESELLAQYGFMEDTPHQPTQEELEDIASSLEVEAFENEGGSFGAAQAAEFELGGEG